MITGLATDPHLMNDWDRDGTGNPGVGLFADAVQVWSIANGPHATVQAAAVAFRVPRALIEQAVEHHPWMYLDAHDVIGHEGE